MLDTVYFLLSVNVSSISISADFSFYYRVLSQLSRIVPNYGDSHKSNLYQNEQTCILEVNSTRIAIPLEVLPHNTMVYYPKLKSTYFHHC